MMLPGVEVARKRRMHNHNIHPWVPHDHNLRSPVRSSMPEPAMAARMRLEEKLRGTGSGSTTPSNSTSRWTQFLCDGASMSRQQSTNNETTSGWVNQIESTQKSTVLDNLFLNKSALKADGLCAVCLKKVKGKKTAILLPCSHNQSF